MPPPPSEYDPSLASLFAQSVSIKNQNLHATATALMHSSWDQ